MIPDRHGLLVRRTIGIGVAPLVRVFRLLSPSERLGAHQDSETLLRLLEGL